MRTVEGNLLDLAEDGMFDVIVHGCNCFRTMGSGIARQIKERYPAAYLADQLTVTGEVGKLGEYTSATIDAPFHTFTVVNGYTQWKYGVGQDHVDYQAMGRLFEKIALDFDGQRIGYPKIGAGLAGGDWGRISQIIESKLWGQDHTLVVPAR